MDSFANVVNLPNFHSLSVKLDRSNYAFWRAQVLSTARAHGFDDLLDKFHTPPMQFLPTPSGERHNNPEFFTWIRRDQYMMSWLLSSISESMLGNITRCITSRDIWLAMENLFQSQSKARVMQLKLKLQTTKKGDLSVDDYVMKMRGFADQLAAAGKNITDDDLALQILAGFGMEYDAVVVNFTNRPDSLNLQDVHYALQAHEIRLQSQNSSFYPSAHVAYNRGATDSGYGNRGGMLFRGRGGRSFSRDSKIICQLCGKPGHIALKCFKRFDVHFTGITSPYPQAYYTDTSTHEVSQEEYGYHIDPDSNWVVDSGATNHITHNLANLQVSNAYNGGDNVAVGNGAQLPIASTGQEHSSNVDEGSTGPRPQSA